MSSVEQTVEQAVMNRSLKYRLGMVATRHGLGIVSESVNRIQYLEEQVKVLEKQNEVLYESLQQVVGSAKNIQRSFDMLVGYT